MSRDLVHELNHAMPAFAHVSGSGGKVGFGNLLQQIITNQNAILAKLDAIGGAADVAAINAAAGTTSVATLAIPDLVTQGKTSA